MKKPILIVFFAFILGYSLFQGRYIILGPELEIAFPKNGQVMEAGPMVVSGRVENISYLSLNDGQIYTNKEGYFEEKLIAQRGTNIIKITAKDRFGRVTEKLVEIVAR